MQKMIGFWKRFWKEEDGVGVVEIILILVVLVALVVIFKDEVSAIVEKAFRSITGGANKIIGMYALHLLL